ncbi:MAG: flagellar hook-associated protein FlgL [Clostridium sp.]|uniref:flagellar hook-associated protein FlgL n=1 Tax=Clostridium sp. TaxID=1506 RepID=UPI002FC771F9
MRVTNRVMINNYLHNLSRNQQAMGKLQMQLSTGHKVSRPSDDPFVVTRTMELKSSIAANERYKQNIEEARGWTDTQEMALGQMNDVLHKVRELTVQASNDGALSDADKKAISTQLQQLKEQLVEIGNTSYDGRYVFSGQKTTEKPFEIFNDPTNAANPNNGKVVYKGSNAGLDKELAPGVSLDIGIAGSELFKDKYTSNTPNPPTPPNPFVDNVGIFSTIDELINSIENGGDTSALLGKLDENIENITTIRGASGARQNRLEDMHAKNESETFNMTTLLSKTYDIDVAEKYMEAKVMESVFQASLNVGAMVMQPSILDFLR